MGTIRKKKLTPLGKKLFAGLVGFTCLSAFIAIVFYNINEDIKQRELLKSRNFEIETQIDRISQGIETSFLDYSEFEDFLEVEQPKNKQVLTSEEREIADGQDASSEKAGVWYGLCKKDSISSIQDFKNYVESDKTLGDYYAGFNWETARIGYLSNNVKAKVAHRKGEKIMMTSNEINLPKGDGFITDGYRTVRTHCCNDYQPYVPTHNPPIVTSSNPPTHFTPWSDYGTFMGGGFNDGYFMGGSFSTYCSVNFPNRPDHPVHPIHPEHPVHPGHPGHPDKPHHPDIPDAPVPEPATMLLFGVGLISLAFIGRKHKR